MKLFLVLCFFSKKLLRLCLFLFRRPSRFSGTRKHSVPGRVHSVCKNDGCLVFIDASSRTWLARGTVESLPNFILAICFFAERESDRVQSVNRAFANTVPWLPAAFPKSFMFALWLGSLFAFRGRYEPDHTWCSGSSYARPLWPICRPALWSPQSGWSAPSCDQKTCGIECHSVWRN